MRKDQRTQTLAPIVLFVYNRPIHTRKTIEALQKNELAAESELYIYCDAPKDEQAESKVAEVRQYVKHEMDHSGFKKVTIVEQSYNKGLATSVIEGVTQIVNAYGRVIVMEDDLISSPLFLSYMNNALERYANAKNVYSVCGYSYLAEKGYKIDKILMPEAYFLQYYNSWGWGTWKDRWAKFDPLSVGWEKIKTDERMQKRFSLNGLRPDVYLLTRQMEENIDSWALRWWWSIFKNDGISLFPNRTFIQNIGWDGSGVHGAGGDPDREVEMVKNYSGKLPEKATERYWIRRQMINAWKPSIPRRIINKLRRILHGKA